MVTKPGDAVGGESPSVYWLLQAGELMGLRAVELPAHPRHGIRLDELEAAIDAHGIRA